jgi:hypothetical protein
MSSETSHGRSSRRVALGAAGDRGEGSGLPAANRWIALAVLSLAQLMIVLDGTIVNIALPTAQYNLGFSTDDRQWVVTGYALALGSLAGAVVATILFRSGPLPVDPDAELLAAPPVSAARTPDMRTSPAR